MFFVIFLAVLFIFLFNEFYWKRRGLPPGPMPLPIVGNLYEYFSAPPPGLGVFEKWTKQYGNIYTIWMTTEPTVVITGYDALKETFINDSDTYMDKKIFKGFNQSMRGGDYGVIDVNGEKWREHRRFALHTLRDFGLGKELMESKILLEVDALEKELRKNGKDVDIATSFDYAIGNIINQFLFGHQFKDKSKFNKLKGLIDQFMVVSGSLRINLLYLLPFVSIKISEYFAPDLIECREGLFGFFTEQIDEHRLEIDHDADQDKDFVEAFLKEQKRRAENGSDSFSDIQLKNMLFDMWVAGMHTTTNTMAFLVAFAILNQEAQRKMQEELSYVIGDRTVLMKDKLDLPYTNAFINEAQRLANLLPINLIHATTKDVQLAGHTVPKGTAIIHQIASVMSDPKVFPDPDSFKPERFLDSNGKLLKIDELVPFSVGKRICLGEGLARMELFLITANIFNKFHFSAGSNGEPSLERTFSFIAKVMDYECCTEPRYNA